MTNTKQRIKAWTGIIAVFALAISPIVASTASAVTANTTINATIGSTISLVNTGTSTVTIGVSPTASAAMSSASDEVSVSTNSTTGYTLKLGNGDTNLNLVSGGNNITPDAGTFASPSATLSTNAWGYRVDGAGTFGAGPTSAETNVTSSTYKWAGVPTAASPDTIKATAVTASSDLTKFWYGVKVDNTKPTGVYTDTVTYTATVNP